MSPLDNGMAAINAAYYMLPDTMASKEATVMLLAIGLQESRFTSRWQITKPHDPRHMGPARGWWQFEAGGGVYGVNNHRSSRFHAEQLCRIMKVKTTEVWSMLHRPDMDALAAGYARLLLWTDPRALPKIGDAEEAWALYARVWRPGRPHRQTWDDLYKEAMDYAMH